jgi:hypothetical protein
MNGLRRTAIHHQFVEFMPPELQEGVLYVSVQYATAAHLCACGCGNKVVTPISPVDWQMLFDGDTVSLTPSIGNWQFPCRSHYWIKLDKIRWAGAWTDEQIAAGRQREARDAELYFARRRATTDSPEQPGIDAPAKWQPYPGPIARFLRRFIPF